MHARLLLYFRRYHRNYLNVILIPSAIIYFHCYQTIERISASVITFHKCSLHFFRFVSFVDQLRIYFNSIGLLIVKFIAALLCLSIASRLALVCLLLFLALSFDLAEPRRSGDCPRLIWKKHFSSFAMKIWMWDWLMHKAHWKRASQKSHAKGKEKIDAKPSSTTKKPKSQYSYHFFFFFRFIAIIPMSLSPLWSFVYLRLSWCICCHTILFLLIPN